MRRYSDEETRQRLTTLEHRVSSATVALRTVDGKVLVLKATYKDYWSFPGGIIDTRETPRAAAVRECLEEVNIQLSEDELEFVIVVDRVSEYAHTYQFVFQATVAAEVLEGAKIDKREIEMFDVVMADIIVAGERHYSQTALAWARGERGYREQVFGAGTRE